MTNLLPPARTTYPYWPAEFTESDKAIVRFIVSEGWTMVGPERLYSVILSLRHVVQQAVPGDFVECGVWRGGVSIMIGLWLKENNVLDRKIYMYDTFDGMTEPTEVDVRTRDKKPFLEIARDHEAEGRGDSGIVARAGLDHVKQNFRKAGVGSAALHFIEGDVLASLDVASNLPVEIALLRLDTDWYESTRKELEVLYPRLQRNGVLLLDDYGYYDGCRQAVDEYFEQVPRPLLHLDDEYGRSGIKF